MLQTVDVGMNSLDDYKPLIRDEKANEIRKLARELHGARILHLNATPYLATRRRLGPWGVEVNRG